MEPSTSGNAANDDLTAEKLKSMNIKQLKQELKNRKLKTSGVKDDLVQRLLAYRQLQRALQCYYKTKYPDNAKDANRASVSKRSQATTSKVRRNQLTLNWIFEDGEESLETSSEYKVSKRSNQDDAFNIHIRNIKRSKNDTRITTKVGQYGAMKKEGKSQMKQSREKKETMIREDTSSTETKRCFNCGSRNHLCKACPMKDKGAKCFECNQYGHIAKLCKERLSTQNRMYNC